jgi:subtilisin family serine protease
VKNWLIVALVAGSAMAGCARLGPIGDEAAPQERSLARQLLITTRQDPGASMSVLGDPSAFYFRRRGYGPAPEVDRLLDEIAGRYAVRRVEGWYIASIGEYCEVYELGPEQDPTEVMALISAHPGVELVQRMNVFETEGIVYDDPYASMQPALAELAIETAHEIATGRGVTVAIVDSNVDRRHRELRGKIASARNLVDGRAFGTPEVHGTAVAGIIGSAANNGEGIVGIAPDATIASLRACWTVDAGSGRARCSSFSLALALELAIGLEADVVNLSLAGPFDPLLSQLIDSAIGHGIIVVAAAPDVPAPDNDFPSSHPHVIAAESSDAPAVPEPRNRLRAPGAEVMSTTPHNGYAFFSGNSMSAAYISGVSALVREHRPEIRADEMIRLLADTGRQQAVNACRAIAGPSDRDRCPVDDD